MRIMQAVRHQLQFRALIVLDLKGVTLTIDDMPRQRPGLHIIILAAKQVRRLHRGAAGFQHRYLLILLRIGHAAHRDVLCSEDGDLRAAQRTFFPHWREHRPKFALLLFIPLIKAACLLPAQPALDQLILHRDRCILHSMTVSLLIVHIDTAIFIELKHDLLAAGKAIWRRRLFQDQPLSAREPAHHLRRVCARPLLQDRLRIIFRIDAQFSACQKRPCGGVQLVKADLCLLIFHRHADQRRLSIRQGLMLPIFSDAHLDRRCVQDISIRRLVFPDLIVAIWQGVYLRRSALICLDHFDQLTI